MQVDPYDEMIERQIIAEQERRRSYAERRAEVRCECGHGPIWHPASERCYGHSGTCECSEYRPQPDRRAP